MHICMYLSFLIHVRSRCWLQLCARGIVCVQDMGRMTTGFAVCKHRKTTWKRKTHLNAHVSWSKSENSRNWAQMTCMQIYPGAWNFIQISDIYRAQHAGPQEPWSENTLTLYIRRPCWLLIWRSPQSLRSPTELVSLSITIWLFNIAMEDHHFL